MEKYSFKYLKHVSIINHNYTFQGMFAFQQRHASLRCCKMVLALFCLMPSAVEWIKDKYSTLFFLEEHQAKMLSNSQKIVALKSYRYPQAKKDISKQQTQVIIQ